MEGRAARTPALLCRHLVDRIGGSRARPTPAPGRPSVCALTPILAPLPSSRALRTEGTERAGDSLANPTEAPEGAKGRS